MLLVCFPWLSSDFAWNSVLIKKLIILVDWPIHKLLKTGLEDCVCFLFVCCFFMHGKVNTLVLKWEGYITNKSKQGFLYCHNCVGHSLKEVTISEWFYKWWTICLDFNKTGILSQLPSQLSGVFFLTSCWTETWDKNTFSVIVNYIQTLRN